MSVDGVKTLPDVEFQKPARGSPLFFDPSEGRVAASTRAEVRCVWKLGMDKVGKTDSHFSIEKMGSFFVSTKKESS